MENKFHENDLVLNPYQDPMGDDAHSGLERFLDTFHKPGDPVHTIITDPEYFVFLWFHDALGNLIRCPYLNAGYKPLLEGTSQEFDKTNAALCKTPSIQAGVGQ